MYKILRDKAAFTKYQSLMDFLEYLGCTIKKELRPGNAQLTSEHLKDEIITILGTQSLCCIIKFHLLVF